MAEHCESSAQVNGNNKAEAFDALNQKKLLRKAAPFTSDPECELTRLQIKDYGKPNMTKEMAENSPVTRPVRIYADGIYDMFHSGHARQLMQAKAVFPNVYLIIGVVNDSLTLEMKGRTVMNDVERYEAVRHCRYVDELVPDAPWTLDIDFLNKHKIDFVAHDDLPYGSSESEDIYEWLKKRGQFVATQRTEGISTTDVIARIIKDYDLYIRRNLARGYSAKELNVSFMRYIYVACATNKDPDDEWKKTHKHVFCINYLPDRFSGGMEEKKLQFQDKVDLMKGRLADKRTELFTKWEDMSRDFIGGFMDLFSRDGRLKQLLVDGKQRVVNAISPPPSPSTSPTGSPTLDNDKHKTINLNESLETKRRRVECQQSEDDSDEDNYEILN